MPYIPQDTREYLDKHGFAPRDAGELNYIITKICERYIYERGARYQYFNDVIGVLECVKQEYYRRRIAPYEDKKMQENGDVF